MMALYVNMKKLIYFNNKCFLKIKIKIFLSVVYVKIQILVKKLFIKIVH